MNESCRTHEYDIPWANTATYHPKKHFSKSQRCLHLTRDAFISHIWTSNITHMNEHTTRPHCQKFTPRNMFPRLRGSLNLIRDSFTSHIWTSHVAHMNQHTVRPHCHMLSHEIFSHVLGDALISQRTYSRQTYQRATTHTWMHILRARGGGLGSSTIFKKFNEPYAPS